MGRRLTDLVRLFLADRKASGYAARTLEKGKASLRHIQEMLGHELLSTTQIYTRVDISDLSAVHRRGHPRGRR